MKNNKPLIVSFFYSLISMGLLGIGMVTQEILKVNKTFFIFVYVMWFSICLLVGVIGIWLYFEIRKTFPEE